MTDTKSATNPKIQNWLPTTIKIAVNIAAHVASGSTLFYGNEFDLELFKKQLEKKSK